MKGEENEEEEEEEEDEIEIINPHSTTKRESDNNLIKIDKNKLQQNNDVEEEEEEDEIEINNENSNKQSNDERLSESSKEESEESSEMGEIMLEDKSQQKKPLNPAKLINFFSTLGESIQSLKIPSVHEMKIPPARSNWEVDLRKKNNALRKTMCDKVYKGFHLTNSNLKVIENNLTDSLISAQKVSQTMQLANQRLNQILVRLKESRNFVESKLEKKVN